MAYETRQAGGVTLWTVGAAAVIVAAVSWATTGSLFNIISLMAVPILALTGYLFSSLTVRVDERHLRWHFGPGFWKKSIDRREIVAVAPAQFKWWHGYGIRITPRGWLYRVSGYNAVGVTLASGKTIFIGTDTADDLAAALQPLSPSGG